jgi:small subunit ribosomal protein S8
LDCVEFALEKWQALEKYQELKKPFGNLFINKNMTNDVIADFLARMQNAIVRKNEEIVVPSAKMVDEMVRILKDEKMIGGFEKDGKNIKIILLYNEGEAVISKFRRISKSGQRIYVKADKILPIMNGRGISIVSTSFGVMTGAQAKNKSLGGELICEIW